MSVGEGVAFAALMWMIVQIAYLLHHMSKTVNVDELKDRIDRLAQHLEEYIGQPMEPHNPKSELELRECLDALDVQNATIADIVSKYNELIFAVGKKFPGESRHETALRYILRMEEPSTTEAASSQ